MGSQNCFWMVRNRRLPSKRILGITDLGNDIQRFGKWEVPLDWQFAFENPETFAKQLQYHLLGSSTVQSHSISAGLQVKFAKALEMTIDVEAVF